MNEYFKTSWIARVGTGLSRFLKSGESTEEVTLVNSPTSISEPGTPFSVVSMNNIEDGIGDLYDGGLNAIEGIVSLDGVDNVRGLASNSEKNIYATKFGTDDIYRSTDGVTFVALGEFSAALAGVAVDSSGVVYVCESNGDIYKSVDGISFTGLGETSRLWSFITIAPNGDVYATVTGGDIYKQTAGAGAFNALSTGFTGWSSITADTDGDIYVSRNGALYKQTGGTGSFDGVIGADAVSNFGMKVDSEGFIWFNIDSDGVYKMETTTYARSQIYSINTTLRDIAVEKDGDILYLGVSGIGLDLLRVGKNIGMDIPVFSTNADAVTGGLSTGMIYRDSSGRTRIVTVSGLENLEVGADVVALGSIIGLQSKVAGSAPYREWLETDSSNVDRNMLRMYLSNDRLQAQTRGSTGSLKYTLWEVVHAATEATSEFIIRAPLTVDLDLYVGGDCSALTFTDRTPYPKDIQTAIDVVKSVGRIDNYDENDKHKQVDHDKLHDFIRVEKEKPIYETRTKKEKDEKGIEIDVEYEEQIGTEIEKGRDLSATVSSLVEVVKHLLDEIEILKGK